MLQKQPFSGVSGEFGVGGIGGAPCLGTPSCPQAGSISFLAFHRRLLSPTVPVLGNTSRTRAAAAPSPAPRAARLRLSQQSTKPFPPRARSQAGVLLKTSFITATQKCQCRCGPDKSLLAIKTVTRCKQQQL